MHRMTATAMAPAVAARDVPLLPLLPSLALTNSETGAHEPCTQLALAHVTSLEHAAPPSASEEQTSVPVDALVSMHRVPRAHCEGSSLHC